MLAMLDGKEPTATQKQELDVQAATLRRFRSGAVRPWPARATWWNLKEAPGYAQRLHEHIEAASFCAIYDPDGKSPDGGLPINQCDQRRRRRPRPN